MSDQAFPAAGTIVARNYLPAARVLAGSFLRHHPGGRFAVLVVDAADEELDALAAAAPEIEILGPGHLDIPAEEYGRMAFAYSVTELSTSVKPWLLRRLLKDSSTAIYLDPDIEIFAPFAGYVRELAERHDIVLTPHVLEPMPRDGKRPSESDIMASGVFNLGFIGVSGAAEPFLEFWAERLRQDAISSITEQLFTDQRWVDNVPALFRHTVIRDPGFNVAYWNVYQRPMDRDANGRITAAGEPLKFVHYSGYRPEKPWLASTHFSDKPRVLLSEQPLLAELCAGYRDQLIAAGYSRALDEVPYRWNQLPDGTKVSPSLRRAFRQAWVDAERDEEPAPPSPFHRDPAEFLRWATEPATAQQKRAGINRWLLSIWQYRPDLQRAFPDPLNADAEAFRSWCAHSGISEAEIPASVLALPEQSAPVAIEDTVGVNVLGYLTAELGVGEMGRLAHDSVTASGVPVATIVEDSTVSNRTGHPLPSDARLSDPVYPVSVLCVNADMTAATLGRHPDLAGGRHVIGLWSWELEDFPPAMHKAFELVDEVWTISEFCATAIEKFSPVPVRVFPVPVRDPFDGRVPPRRPADDTTTTVLFAFDYNSVFERKNPLGAVAAFTRAFPDRDDVRLVIKSINGAKHPGDRERLRAAVLSDPRITLIEDYRSADEVRDLYSAADCYLSLHRSEGFGLTVAEAMAHGLPVIATDYSGTAETLVPGTGWPVPSRLVPVGKDNGPYPPEALWAEPDIGAAAAALREVAEDLDGARERGRAAREHVLKRRSFGAAAKWARERIEAACERHREGHRDAGELSAPVRAVRDAREALTWRADPSAASKVPLASALRRAVLRLIDHYDHHQRTVISALLDGVESGLDQVVTRQQETDRQVEHLTRHLERLDRDRGRLDRRLAASTDAVADLERQLVEERAKAAARLEDLRRATAGRVDDLDAKLMRLLCERDQRLTHVERATADTAGAVPALREGLRRHHDLLDPPVGQVTETVPTDVGLLRLPADDTVVLPWLRTYGSWETDESRLIDRLLPEGGVFVDIGAHVGYFTVRALRQVGPKGTVVAVEPWKPVRELLERNVAANVPGAVDALTVVPAAAWDDSGELRLALSADGNSGDNRITPDGQIAVPALRLDSLAALVGKRIDVVKSDAQGCDHRAIAGLSELFAQHLPHVLCEFDPAAIRAAGSDPVAVLQGYRGLGYRLVPVTAELVSDAEQADDLRVPCPSDTTGDDELVAIALADPAGFITLWLRPEAL